MGIIGRMKCRFTTGHNYHIYKSMMIDAGMGKIKVYRCDCGSTKRLIV